MKAHLKDKFRTESNFKFVAAAIVVLGLIGMLIFAPRGKEFQLTAEREIKVAMEVCRASTEWVLANRRRLKIDAAELTHIKVNGQVPKFKYTKTPKVVYIASGFDAPNMLNNIFCEVTHAATKQKYYFDYENRVWRDKIRFRR